MDNMGSGPTPPGGGSGAGTMTPGQLSEIHAAIKYLGGSGQNLRPTDPYYDLLSPFQGNGPGSFNKHGALEALGFLPPSGSERRTGVSRDAWKAQRTDMPAVDPYSFWGQRYNEWDQQNDREQQQYQALDGHTPEWVRNWAAQQLSAGHTWADIGQTAADQGISLAALGDVWGLSPQQAFDQLRSEGGRPEDYWPGITGAGVMPPGTPPTGMGNFTTPQDLNGRRPGLGGTNYGGAAGSTNGSFMPPPAPPPAPAPSPGFNGPGRGPGGSGYFNGSGYTNPATATGAANGTQMNPDGTTTLTNFMPGQPPRGPSPGKVRSAAPVNPTYGSNTIIPVR